MNTNNQKQHPTFFKLKSCFHQPTIYAHQKNTFVKKGVHPFLQAKQKFNHCTLIDDFTTEALNQKLYEYFVAYFEQDAEQSKKGNHRYSIDIEFNNNPYKQAVNRCIVLCGYDYPKHIWQGQAGKGRGRISQCKQIKNSKILTHCFQDNKLDEKKGTIIDDKTSIFSQVRSRQKSIQSSHCRTQKNQIETEMVRNQAIWAVQLQRKNNKYFKSRKNSRLSNSPRSTPPISEVHDQINKIVPVERFVNFIANFKYDDYSVSSNQQSDQQLSDMGQTNSNISSHSNQSKQKKDKFETNLKAKQIDIPLKRISRHLETNISIVNQQIKNLKENFTQSHYSQQLVKTLLIYVPNQNSQSKESGYRNSKLANIFNNYLHFQPSRDIATHQFSLGQYLQDFLFQNSVGEIQFHFRVPQYSQSNTITETSNSTKIYSGQEDCLDLVKKLGAIKELQKNRQDSANILRLYRMKVLAKDLAKQIKSMKSDLLIRINELLQLIDLPPVQYLSVDLQLLKKIRDQQIKKKTDRIKQLMLISNSLDMRLKDGEQRKQFYKKKIAQQEKQYLGKVSSLRMQILNIQSKINKKQVQSNNKKHNLKQNFSNMASIQATPSQNNQININKSQIKRNLTKNTSIMPAISSVFNKAKTLILDQNRQNISRKYGEILKQIKNQTMSKLMEKKKNQTMFEAERQFQKKRAAYANANIALKMILMDY